MANTCVAGDTVLMQYEGLAGDQQIINDYAVVFTGHPSDVDYPTDASVLDQLHAAMSGDAASWYQNNFIPHMPPQFSVTRSRFGLLLSGGSPPIPNWVFRAEQIYGEALTGGYAGDADPSFEAVSVQLRSSFPGRNGRGSKHFGPVADNTFLLNTMIPGELVIWTSIVVSMITGNNVRFLTMGPSDLKCVMAVASLQKYQLGAFPASAPITSYVVNTFAGSMFSRKSYNRGH